MKTPSHRNLETLGILRDVKDAIRNPYAWPGGYPKTIILDDSELLCATCAEKEFHNVCRDTLCGYSGWCAISVDIIWEGGNHCNHCGTCVDACPAEKGARL